MSTVQHALPAIDELLRWPSGELPRIRYLVGLRRYWMTELYGRLRREYDERVDADAPPVSMAAAQPIVDELPSLGYFLWLDQHIQEQLWREVERMVDTRIEVFQRVLDPRPDDLGTLETAAEFPYPDYYAGFDFHRQDGGIWRDVRGAIIYAMGARVIHVGRNDGFELHDRFADTVPLEDPATVLDVACGFGKTTFSLKRRFPDAQVHAVDLSAPCLRLGRRMATERDLEIHWRQADAERLPYDDDTFALVTVTMALHELPMSSIHGAVAEVARVLAPGGTFVTLENRVIGDPLRDLLGAYHSSLIGEPYMNAFRATPFTEFAQAAGFAAAQEQPWYPPGAAPGGEHDPANWSSPWRRLVAHKAAA